MDPCPVPAVRPLRDRSWGMLAQSIGWATAARGADLGGAARHLLRRSARPPRYHRRPRLAAIVGGCVGASTPAGARLAGLAPTGTMPHSLVLILATPWRPLRHPIATWAGRPRIVPVDTFKDEAESAPGRPRPRRPAVRHPPRYASERGRVTPDLVHEIRARSTRQVRPRQDRRSGWAHPGADPSSRRPARQSTRTRSARSSVAPRRSTPPATSRRSTGAPIAKRGRIPGLTDSPAAWSVRSR